MNFLNKFLNIFILINLMCLQAFAFDIDTSVDDEIRKKYNVNKIEEDMEKLPPLPSILKDNTANQKPVSKQLPIQNSNSTVKTTPQTVQYSAKSIIIPKNTKFSVRLASKISDGSSAGTPIKFATQRITTYKNLKIDSGTIFIGEVVDSHRPQITGNGGLIVINVHSMLFNGSPQGINASITKANHKKIFFNNIKGARKYLSNTYSGLTPGKKFYAKMMTSTATFANKGGGWLILTPFTIASGVVVIGVNTIASPVFAIFSKGGPIILPVGTAFEIKLLEDAVIYY